MATSFPTALDNFTNPTGTDPLSSVTVPHASQHANLNDAVEAIEAKLGVDGSIVTTSIDYRLKFIEDNGAGGGAGTGSLLCYDSTGAQDDIPVQATAPLQRVSITDDLILGAAADIDIGTNGTFGWRDNIQGFSLKANDAASPSYGITIGNFKGYIWSASQLNEAFVDFHIDHDYAMGTVIYPHVHFKPLTNGSGVVRWGFEYSVTKGHGQQVGTPASTTVYVNFTVNANNLGTHYVAEVALADAIPATYLEPDAVVTMRVFRDAANAADTYAGTVWAWQSDLHYQASRFATLNRAPNFYG